MKEDERDALRARIKTELEACRKEIERLEEAISPVAPDKALGRLTRMESLHDQGVLQSSLNQQVMKRGKLEQALKNVDAPGYGNCILCRQPIPVERLLAMPETNRCVRCAQ